MDFLRFLIYFGSRKNPHAAGLPMSVRLGYVVKAPCSRTPGLGVGGAGGRAGSRPRVAQFRGRVPCQKESADNTGRRRVDHRARSDCTATIIALSIVYNQERQKKASSANGGGGEGAVTIAPTSSPAITTAPSNDPWNKYRLPDTLSPSEYHVTLWPRLVEDQNGMYIFTGSSSVVFTCVKETDLVLIHSNKLNLTKINGEHLARLTAVDQQAVPTVKDTWLQVETQYLVVQLEGTLTVGRSYQLDTEFQGELADDLGGFYRSEYHEDDIKK
ncbi:hypothetical protein AGOR_G00163120 [Albula goreensis]|uniref:Aminopeptidase N-like N-terminal domain-containing protein n=1 Tax=Albula goreensis TaxID=1534307 RepID=A0A8T3D0H2_9TELE|nr:hypothetical protein AGOR_G00163120 [Albula goreensis]